MSQQIFCGRPGCGLAKSAHGFAPDACSNFIGKGSKEARALEPTKVESSPVDSSLLDRVLMAGALEHLQARIKTATTYLQFGLKCQEIEESRRFFNAALEALGSLGAA